MSKSFYITTTLPYVNSDPHIGFAMEIIRADIIARAKELQGFEVFFNTGTDEHGQKIFDNAKTAGKAVQDFVNKNSLKFKNLKESLGLLPTIHFIRTTDTHHIKSAQEFWQRCAKAGDIYKKNYKIKYCVGCELEKQDSEIIDGKCELHPNIELEIREEENFFFKFSKFEKLLLEFYEKNPKFVVPDFRFNEIKAFVKRGLQDFSISRLKSKMSWGVPVPEDLVNFEKFWKNGTPVQYCGKDNLRQQSAMWQAMLMSVGLPQSNTIVIDGFITNEGQKMSKSLGNATNPKDLVAEYGIDALRYYVARELSTFEDSDVSLEKFKKAYNANLANGLGNLVSRVMKMAEWNLEKPVSISEWEDMSDYFSYLENFEIGKGTDYIWVKIGEMDSLIQKTEPFKLVKTNKSPEKPLFLRKD